MGEFSLDKLQERKDPLLLYRWICVELPFYMDINYVESISLPFPTVDVVDPLYGAGTFFHYPGFVRVDSFSMTMYEDETFVSTKWLMGWIGKIRNYKYGWYNLPTIYKRDMTFALYDNTETEIVQAKIRGCFPTQIANLELNYTSSERAIINATFSADSVEFISERSFGQFIGDAAGGLWDWATGGGSEPKGWNDRD